MSAPTNNNPPAGFYDDGNGRERWFDGSIWTDHYKPVTPQAAPAAAQPVYATGPLTAGGLNVKREVVYNRQQKGHSVIKHVLLGWLLLWIPTIYYSVSPNHYWHA